MKLAGWFLVAVFVIAAAQAVAIVLYLAIVLAFIVGFVAAPREAFGLLALCLIIAYPLPFLGLCVLVIVAGILKRHCSY
jgi:quinol-cytochrome oxidoreductase complex cytochrome b subunit